MALLNFIIFTIFHVNQIPTYYFCWQIIIRLHTMQHQLIDPISTQNQSFKELNKAVFKLANTQWLMCICILFLYSFFFFLVSAYHSWVSINTLDFEVQKLTEADWKQSGVISLLLQNWLRFTCTSVHLLNMRPLQRLFKFLKLHLPILLYTNQKPTFRLKPEMWHLCTNLQGSL